MLSGGEHEQNSLREKTDSECTPNQLSAGFRLARATLYQTLSPSQHEEAPQTCARIPQLATRLSNHPGSQTAPPRHLAPSPLRRSGEPADVFGKGNRFGMHLESTKRCAQETPRPTPHHNSTSTLPLPELGCMLRAVPGPTSVCKTSTAPGHVLGKCSGPASGCASGGALGTAESRAPAHASRWKAGL